MKRKSTVCRLCTKDDGVFLDIFGSLSQKVVYYEDISRCLSCKVEKDDGLPDKICVKCVGVLSDCRPFVDKVHKLGIDQKSPSSREEDLVDNCHFCVSSENYLFPIPKSSVTKTKDCFDVDVPLSVKICHRCQFYLDTLHELKTKACASLKQFYTESSSMKVKKTPTKEDTVDDLVHNLKKKYIMNKPSKRASPSAKIVEVQILDVAVALGHDFFSQGTVSVKEFWKALSSCRINLPPNGANKNCDDAKSSRSKPGPASFKIVSDEADLSSSKNLNNSDLNSTSSKSKNASPAKSSKKSRQETLKANSNSMSGDKSSSDSVKGSGKKSKRSRDLIDPEETVSKKPKLPPLFKKDLEKVSSQSCSTLAGEDSDDIQEPRRGRRLSSMSASEGSDLPKLPDRKERKSKQSKKTKRLSSASASEGTDVQKSQEKKENNSSRPSRGSRRLSTLSASEGLDLAESPERKENSSPRLKGSKRTPAVSRSKGRYDAGSVREETDAIAQTQGSSGFSSMSVSEESDLHRPTSKDNLEFDKENEGPKKRKRRSVGLKKYFNEEGDEDEDSPVAETKRQRHRPSESEDSGMDEPSAASTSKKEGIEHLYKIEQPSFLRELDELLKSTPKSSFRPFICNVCHEGYISTVKGKLHNLVVHDPHSNITLKLRRCDSSEEMKNLKDVFSSLKENISGTDHKVTENGHDSESDDDLWKESKKSIDSSKANTSCFDDLLSQDETKEKGKTSGDNSSNEESIVKENNVSSTQDEEVDDKEEEIPESETQLKVHISEEDIAKKACENTKEENGNNEEEKVQIENESEIEESSKSEESEVRESSKSQESEMKEGLNSEECEIENNIGSENSEIKNDIKSVESQVEEATCADENALDDCGKKSPDLKEADESGREGKDESVVTEADVENTESNEIKEKADEESNVKETSEKISDETSEISSDAPGDFSDCEDNSVEVNRKNNDQISCEADKDCSNLEDHSKFEEEKVVTHNSELSSEIEGDGPTTGEEPQRERELCETNNVADSSEDSSNLKDVSVKETIHRDESNVLHSSSTDGTEEISKNCSSGEEKDPLKETDEHHAKI